MKANTPPQLRLIQAFLDRLRWRRSWEICLRVASMILVGFVGMLFLRGLADTLLDFPRPLRLLLLTLDVFLVAGALWWWGWLSLRAVRGRRGAALYAERLEPQLRSSVISSVELAGRPQATAYLPHIFRRAEKVISGLDLRRLVPLRRLRFWMFLAATCCLVTGVLVAAFPQTARVVLLRYLGFAVPRPSRTQVLPVTRDLQKVVGDSVLLEARAQGVIPRSGRIRLSMQGAPERLVEVAPHPREPDLFQFSLENVQGSFTYQFLLNDGTGERYRVTATPPPRVLKLTLRVAEPAYTGRPPEDQTEPPFRLFAGSKVELLASASEPLSLANLRLGRDGPEVELAVSGKEIRGSFTVPEEGFDGFTIPLANMQGVRSQPDRLYAVRHVLDQPPTLEVLQPESLPDTIVEGSHIDFVFVAQDDFPLDPPTLQFRIERENQEDQQGALPLPSTPIGEPIAVRWAFSSGTPTPRPEDRVSVWAEVRDAIGQTTRTREWTFRVVTVEEKRAELTEKLRAQSLEIQRLREAQEAAQQELRRTIDNPNDK